MNASLSRHGEEEWGRVRKLLDWAGSFWLSVLFVEDPVPVAELRERAVWNRRWVAAPVRVVLADSPEALAAEADALAEWPGPPGLTWVEGRLAAADGWVEAWTALLSAMNHRRDWLRARAGGIVLVVPDAYRPLVRQVASDLWSVRGPSPTVDASWREALAPAEELGERTITAPEPTRRGSPFVVAGEELDGDLARRAAILLAASEFDAHAADALVNDAERAGHPQLAAVVLNTMSRALRSRDPARAHAAAVRSASLPEVEEETRLESLAALVEDALTVGAVEEAAGPAAMAVALARRRAGEADGPQAQRDLSFSLNKAGGVAEARGRWDEAAAAYDESLAIARRLADQVATPQAQRDLSVSLEKAGGVAQARGRWDEAAAAYDESLALRRLLADQVATPEAQRDLSVSLEKAGGVAEARGRWDEAAAAYDESLAIARSLADQVGTPQAQRDLAAALLNVVRLGRDGSPEVLDEARRAAKEAGDEALIAAVEAAASAFLA